jgi:hypothetical protein
MLSNLLSFVSYALVNTYPQTRPKTSTTLLSNIPIIVKASTTAVESMIHFPMRIFIYFSSSDDNCFLVESFDGKISKA